MELYLDSADFGEIEEAFELGFLAGLTTTPTFMFREGIKDVDAAILKLAEKVPVLQIEALGKTCDEIVAEAKRQDALGLERNRTVYKIPISLEGVKACRKLRDEDFLVNVHLVYTLQQGYMAMAAGATYVCPLIGRLQDQGTDALQLLAQMVEAVNNYGYDTKIMFSSVRNSEHVRNALNAGVHTITAPWSIMKKLTENHFTEIGTRKFFEDTRMVSSLVKDVISKKNPVTHAETTVSECLVKMTADGFGAIAVIDENGRPAGIFTDGDLRRMIKTHGSAASAAIEKKLSELDLSPPLSIEESANLADARALFASKKVDQLVVISAEGKAAGILDIQDLIER